MTNISKSHKQIKVVTYGPVNTNALCRFTVFKGCTTRSSP